MNLALIRCGTYSNGRQTALWKLLISRVSIEHTIPRRHNLITRLTRKDYFKGQHIKDGVPKECIQIFNNNNAIFIRSALIVFNCVVVGISLRLYFYDQEAIRNLKVYHMLTVTNVIFWMIVSCIILNLTYRRTMMRIYKKGDNYYAVVPRWIISSKTFPFQSSDIVRNDSKWKFSKLLRGQLKIMGKPYVLSTFDFKEPMYFNEIFKYDVKMKK